MKLGTVDIPIGIDNPGEWIFQLAMTPQFWREKFPNVPRPNEPPYIGMYLADQPFYISNLINGAKTPIDPLKKPLFEASDSCDVNQRGFAITSPNTASGKYRLFTTNLAPCVSVIIWQPSTQIAALSHWDSSQDYSTLSLMLDEYRTTAGRGDIHIYFHGGTDAIESANTAKGLLLALYSHALTNLIVVRSIDITVRDGDNVIRKCAFSIGIDTRTSLLCPQAYTQLRDLSYDSKIRWVNQPAPPGTYAPGSDGVDMRNYWDNLHVQEGIPIDAAHIALIKREATKIRKQFDGIDKDWIKGVSDLIFTYPVLRAIFLHPSTPVFPPEDLTNFVRSEVDNNALFIERSLRSDSQRDAKGEPNVVLSLIRVLDWCQVGPDHRLLITAAAKQEFEQWITAEKKRQGVK